MPRIVDWLGQHKRFAGVLVITAVVFIAYASALALSFVGDDWIFYELAGRLSLPDYLIKYFDPRVQTAWYRPVQGVLFRIGYDVFGTNQTGYHLVNVLFHLGNSLTLYLLIGRLLNKWLVGFMAGLLFATFPIAVEGVFKAGVIDPVTGLCSLIAIGLWLRYLTSENPRYYWLAFGSFLLALLSKEIAVGLPIVLFLFDRCYVSKPLTSRSLVSRYIWFLIIWIGYVPLEYVVTRRSVFVSHEGYQINVHLVNNLIDYLAGLVFPWGFYSPLSYVLLFIATAALTFAIVVKKKIGLIPVVVGAVLAILPIVLFPQVSFRFLYVSLAASALLMALLFERGLRFAGQTRLGRVPIFALFAALVVFGVAGVMSATADFSEFARVSRVTFRNFRQSHATLPQGTLVYFVDPPIPGPNLSGMLFWYYGAGVSGLATDSGGIASLHNRPSAWVVYFDEHGNQMEQQVENPIRASASPALPASFAGVIRLEGLELVSDTVQRGQPVLLFLYWRGLKQIDSDYLVSVRMMNAKNEVIASYAKPPHHGDAPTSGWTPGDLVVDVVQIPVPASTPAGTYRLEAGLYNPGTLERLAIGEAGVDRIDIDPLKILE